MVKDSFIMENKDVDFIARHYRKECFSPDTGWNRLQIAPGSRRKRFRMAAAAIAAVLFSATAAIIYHEYNATEVARQEVMDVSAASPLKEIKPIDFENAGLGEVVNIIETVYDVKVGNLPDNPEDYTLSLHYEGTPTDLISVINDILGTQMTVTEK